MTHRREDDFAEEGMADTVKDAVLLALIAAIGLILAVLLGGR